MPHCSVKLVSLLFCLLASLLTFNSAWGLTINQFEIRDLEETTSSTFATEAAYWTLSNTINPLKTTTCVGTYILGGYQSLGYNAGLSRTYTSLISHKMIDFKISFWALDLEEATNLFTIYIDGQSIGTWDSAMYGQNSYTPGNICGGSKDDYSAINVQGRVPHTKSDLTLKIVSLRTSSSTFYIGFRDISLLLKNTTSTPAQSVCKFVYPYFSNDLSCLCLGNTFDSGSYFCQTCNSLCQTCIVGNTAGDCTSCPTGYSWNGQQCSGCYSTCSQCKGTAATDCIRCKSATPFLYPDGTCQVSCQDPFVSTTDGSMKYCNYPCSGSDFYYPDKTCKSTCLSPMKNRTDNGIQYCDNPCTGSLFYYPDGSCKSACSDPYSPSTVGTVNYCNYPCSVNSDFYYDNKTCHDTCDAPYKKRTQDGINYCDNPCTGSLYLYPDNSCQSSCTSPYASSTEGTAHFCYLTCDSSSFIYDDGSCKTSCPSPYKPNTVSGVQYCNNPCPGSEYYYSDKSCQSSCLSPYTKVTEGTANFCNPPCSGSGFYYDDKICKPTCPSPFKNRTVNDINYCDNPCTGSAYYYPDSSCRSSCSDPFVPSTQGTANFCKGPCDDSQFYYSDKTCKTSCEAPLEQKTVDIIKYCAQPCHSSEFFNWDQTCVTTCPTESQFTNNTVPSCKFYCAGNGFLYWNQTCGSSCDSPYKSSTDAHSNKFCNLPCPDGEFYTSKGMCQNQCNLGIQSKKGDILYCDSYCPTGYFLNEDGSCSDSCDSPLRSTILDESLKLCSLPCALSQYYVEAEGTCQNSCNSTVTVKGKLQICDPEQEQTDESLISKLFVQQNYTVLLQMAQDVVKGASFVGSVVRPNDRGSVFMIALAKMLKYVTYLDVNLSNEARISFQPHHSLSFSFSSLFSFPMPESLKDLIPKQPLPEIFEETLDHSSYIVNEWRTLSTFFILFCLTLIFTVLDRGLKGTKRPKLILIVRKIKMVLKWNFFLVILFNCYDDLTLYAILEFTTLSLSSTGSFISFFSCLIVTLFGAWILIRTLRIAKEAVKTKKKVVDSRAENPELTHYRKWETFQVCYAGYKNTSLSKQAYLFIFTCRVIVCYVFVGFLHFAPLAQIILFNVLSVLMIGYLIKERPLRSRFNFFVIFVFELLILTVNITLLILVILDPKGTKPSEFRESLGKCILVVNTLVDLLSNVFMWMYILIGFSEAYKKNKALGIQGANLWMNILLVGFQNPGMEFSDYSFSENPQSVASSSAKGVSGPKRLANLPRKKVMPLRNMVSSDIESEQETSPARTKDVIKEHFKFLHYDDNYFSASQNLSGSKVSLNRVTSGDNSPTRIGSAKVEISSGADSEYETKECLPTSPYSSVASPHSEARSLLSVNGRRVYQRPKFLTLTRTSSNTKAPISIIMEEAASGTRKEDGSSPQSKSPSNKDQKASCLPSLLSQEFVDDVDQNQHRKFDKEARRKDRTLKGTFLQPTNSGTLPTSIQCTDVPTLLSTNPAPEEKLYKSRANLLNLLSRKRFENRSISDTDSQSLFISGGSSRSSTLRDSPKENSDTK